MIPQIPALFPLWGGTTNSRLSGFDGLTRPTAPIYLKIQAIISGLTSSGHYQGMLDHSSGRSRKVHFDAGIPTWHVDLTVTSPTPQQNIKIKILINF